MILRREALDLLPRLGWVQRPTPVTALPELARELGAGWLGVKRDDLCRPTSGGSKARKLDFLLADQPFAGAAAWTSAGALGSGHLLCCAEAAALLGRGLVAHLFHEPDSPGVLENLAVTASLARECRYVGSRAGLLLRAPALVLGGRWRGLPVIPPGASNPTGTVGMVRAGLELGEQVRTGELPAPDLVFVALGSGGSAVGLAIGLALGGLASTEVRAVAVVERPLSSVRRLRGLAGKTLEHLAAHDAELAGIRPRLKVVRTRVGRGYGHPSPAALAAMERFDRLCPGTGIALEPVYTAKAMAGLLAAGDLAGRKVLFWQTRHGDLPAPPADWRARLPPRLLSTLERDGAARSRGRRRLLLTTAGLLVAAGGWRFLGYDPPPGWSGLVLGSTEAAVVIALAEALLPEPARAHPDDIARALDRYLVALPSSQRTLARAAFTLVEHGTALSGHLLRCSRLPPRQRRDVVAAMLAAGGRRAQAARAVRDLIGLAWYQNPASWPPLGYEGPHVLGRRPPLPRYARLVAAAGAPLAFGALGAAAPIGSGAADADPARTP